MIAKHLHHPDFKLDSIEADDILQTAASEINDRLEVKKPRPFIGDYLPGDNEWSIHETTICIEFIDCTTIIREFVGELERNGRCLRWRATAVLCDLVENTDFAVQVPYEVKNA